jgi:dihydrodipicolinate synthase/N-acetylneuraminate lyase
LRVVKVTRGLSGVVVATLTPFLEDGRLDERSFAKHVEFLLDSKVDGLFVAGTTGGGPMLALSEKKKLVQLAADISGGDSVTVYVGTIVVSEAVELARYASKLGAKVAVSPPYFYRDVDAEAVTEYISSIVRESSGEVVLYNQPKYTGVSMSLDLLRLLEDRGVSVQGLKDSSGDLSVLRRFVETLHPSIPVLTGSDSLILEGLRIGADGVVSAIANLVPSWVVELYSAFKMGDDSKAERIQARIVHFRRLLKAYSQLSAYYAAGRLMGLSVGLPRPPIRRLKNHELEELRSKLKEAGVLVHDPSPT